MFLHTDKEVQSQEVQQLELALIKEIQAIILLPKENLFTNLLQTEIQDLEA